MTHDFIIPLNGLPEGRSFFSFHAWKEFFEGFENSEILDADVNVDVDCFKSHSVIWLDCAIRGVVTVPCDRCLEDLDIPVEKDVALSVKFSPDGSEEAEAADDGGRETVFFPDDSTELDISQIVYDYVCLSLPLRRVHEAGGCNPAADRLISKDDGFENVKEATSGGESPFASLKGLFQDGE